MKTSFSTPDGPNLAALTELPCLFTYEGDDVVGRIGKIVNSRSKSQGLEIFYELPSHYPQIALDNDDVFKALGIVQPFERSRTHWAVKDVDLFEYATRLLQNRIGDTRFVDHHDMGRVWGMDYNSRVLTFLSHRGEYKRQVAAVKADLEKQGVRCFVAHEDITPTLDWQPEIATALNTMQLFIGFVTDDFHQGSWTDQEIGYAFQRGVTRVFIKLEGSDPKGMAAREQALTADWNNAADRIVAQLRSLSVI